MRCCHAGKTDVDFIFEKTPVGVKGLITECEVKGGTPATLRK